MNNGLSEIDHLMTFVADIEAASRDWERLGFSLTPHSHITAMGIVNRLVLLQSRTPGTANFVELMGVSDASALPPPMRSVLSGDEGVKSMVMATHDAAQAQEALVAAGYPFEPPRHVRREWILPGEGSVWPEFDVLLPIEAPLAFNVCQYHNLPLYQRADWQQHRNGAVSMLACFATAPDPADAIGYFERLFGRASHASAGGGRATSPAAADIVVYAPADFASRFGVEVRVGASASYAGMRIGVADMARMRDCLRDASVPCADQGERIVVGPAHARGSVIEFVEMPQ